MEPMILKDAAGAEMSIDPEAVECIRETDAGVFLVLSRPPIAMNEEAESLANAIGKARRRRCPVDRPKKKDEGKQ